MIIGVVGRSVDSEGRVCSVGTGKDATADALAASGFVKMSFADEMKRFLLRLGFTKRQLWGPSEFRDTPNPALGGCTARHALKTLGTEWGRDMICQTIWVAQTMSFAAELLSSRGRLMYSQTEGLIPRVERGPQGEFEREDVPEIPCAGVVVSDTRFKAEARGLKERGGKLLLVFRPLLRLPKDADLEHQSENDLNDWGVDNPVWDYCLHNTSSLESLKLRAVEAVNSLRGTV